MGSPAVSLERTQIEVARMVKRRPSYVWVSGAYVVVDGSRLYPPLPIREARAYAAELRNNGHTDLIQGKNT